MSVKNVEVCRNAFAALERLDVEASLEFIHPEIVFRSAVVSGAQGKTFRGHDGLRDWAAETEAAFEEIRTVPEEFRDLGADVLVLGRIFARGRRSGATAETPTGFLCTLDAGRIIEATGFLDWDEAIKAAGGHS